MAIWDSGRYPHGYCVPTRLLGTHGYLVGSGEQMVSGNLPIESGHAQGFFFFEKWQSRILDANLGILEALREHWGVLKAVFVFWKIAIWDSGRSPHGYCVPTQLSGTRLLHCTRLLRTHTVIRLSLIHISEPTRPY